METEKPNKTTAIYKKAVISDSWEAALTGMGMEKTDARLTSTARYKKYSQTEIEEIHACDDMFARIVELPAEDMMREGFEVVVPGKPELNQIIQEWMEERSLLDKIQQGLEMARMYGGAALVLGINDGNLAKPLEKLNIENMKSLDYATLLHRHEACGQDPVGDIASKAFGFPSKYRIQPDVTGTDAQINGGQNSASGLEIHASRVLRFEGANVARRIFVQNQYWGESELTRTLNAIRNFNLSHDAVAVVMQHFNQGVFKLTDLNNIIASGNEALLEKRLQMVSTMRSVLRAVVISNDEEFQQQAASLTGVKDVLDQINQRLTQATGIPHTILLGESPSGLGATGESEIRDWYDKVANMQKKKLMPVLESLMKIIFLLKEGPTKGQEPDKWSIKFNPLWQLPGDKKATMHKTQAEADQIYIMNGVVTPEEVRQSRFSDDEFSLETKIDSEANIDPVSEIELMDEMQKIKRALITKQKKEDEADHTHHDINGNEMGPAIDLGNGKHTHFYKGTWTEVAEGPDHTHKEIKTGEVSSGPFPMNQGPDLTQS